MLGLRLLCSIWTPGYYSCVSTSLLLILSLRRLRPLFSGVRGSYGPVVLRQGQLPFPSLALANRLLGLVGGLSCGILAILYILC